MQGTKGVTAELLGRARVVWKGQALRVRSAKGRALLLCLCVRHHGVSRAELAELLWGHGKITNVRQELRTLRALPGAHTWLHADGSVHVRASSDLLSFEQAIARGDHGAALERYGGRLLEGYDPPDAPAFLDWLEVERERLDGMYRGALREHATALERTDRHEDGLPLALRLLELDSLDESAYRSAMRMMQALGRTADALELYAACRRELAAELGTEPLAETTELYDAILATPDRTHPTLLASGGSSAASPGAPATPSFVRTLARILELSSERLTARELAATLDASVPEVLEGLEALRGGAHDGAHGGALERMPDEVREHLHGRIARALEARGAALAAARHFLCAGERTHATTLLLDAARQAEAELRREDALALFLRAAWASPDARGRIEALFDVDRLAAQVGREGLRDAALETLDRETFLLQDDDALIELLLRRSTRAVTRGELHEALELAEEARRNARRCGSLELESRACVMIGGAAFARGEFERAVPPLSFAAEHGGPNERLRALNNLGAVAGVQGRLDDALELQEEALTIARSLALRPLVAALLNNLGATAERTARYGKAAAAFEEAARLYDALGDGRGSAVAWTNLAEITIRSGTYDAALEALCHAERLAAQIDAPAVRCRIVMLRGDVAKRAGGLAAAEAHFREAAELAASMGDERSALTARFNLELTRLLADPQPRPATGWDAVRGALEALERLNLRDTLPWAYAELGLATDDALEARAWAERLQPYDGNRHTRLLRFMVLQHARALEGDAVPVEGLEELAASLQVAETPRALELVAGGLRVTPG